MTRYDCLVLFFPPNPLLLFRHRNLRRNYFILSAPRIRVESNIWCAKGNMVEHDIRTMDKGTAVQTAGSSTLAIMRDNFQRSPKQCGVPSPLTCVVPGRGCLIPRTHRSKLLLCSFLTIMHHDVPSLVLSCLWGTEIGFQTLPFTYHKPEFDEAVVHE
ncbi:hypothetical protein BD410DRAFT_640341 [Rickenella mellea]|uniref:Uncharacterized protein n=1 Tax=Rickenella mellea TaxID=50990 RepID=A0A4Y7PM88_9AGAM|nr:hypothetical protein BD410DRAFT_640341 [Rickenella mellea]